MRLFLTATLCLAASALPAQNAPGGPIARGSRMVSGTASLARVEAGGSGVTTINVNPTVLWFIKDGFALGGELGLGYQTADGFSATMWTLGPAVRWFAARPDARTLPFLGAAVMFGRSSSRFDTFEFSGSSNTLEAVAGATRMLARHVGLTGELFVSRSSSEGSDGTTTSTSNSTTFGLRFGFSAFLF